MARKLSNWLKGLLEYVEETEAPRNFWLWGGIFTIASALQRKVWLPYGLENIYPNLYVLFVAPPGGRKGAPITLAKRMLEDKGINIPVAVDSSSKRAMTKELAQLAKTEQFHYQGKPMPMSSMAVISKEMSSLLALDPKGLIEILTDLFDSHDSWKYKTSGEGHDYLYNVCVGCFIATTPTWLSLNLPQEAIGGGFTTRFAIVSDREKYKLVPRPPEPSKKLYRLLLSDLNRISNLTGPFTWGEGCEDFFDSWYYTIPALTKSTKDERVHGYLERIHIIALKTAMSLRVAYSDELVLVIDDVGRAIELTTKLIKGTSEALGGHGRSKLGPDTERVMRQIQLLKKTTFKEILAMNYRNLTKSELQEILESIEAMGRIRVITDEGGVTRIGWIKGQKEE